MLSKDPVFERLKINMSNDLKGVVCIDGKNIIDDIDSIEYYFGKDSKGKMTQEVVIKYKNLDVKNKNEKLERVEIDSNIRKNKQKK